MAAIKPHRMTLRVMAWVSTVLDTVSATWSQKTAYARKLNPAAHKTAVNGVRTLVDTMVAIEFAAS